MGSQLHVRHTHVRSRAHTHEIIVYKLFYLHARQCAWLRGIYCLSCNNAPPTSMRVNGAEKRYRPTFGRRECLSLNQFHHCALLFQEHRSRGGRGASAPPNAKLGGVAPPKRTRAEIALIAYGAGQLSNALMY